MTRVAHFCTFPHGGAATAAKRLHQGLRSQGVASHFYYHRNQQAVALDDSFSQVEFSPKQHGRLTGAFTRRLDKRRQRRIYQLFNQDLAVRPEHAETFSMAELPEATSLDWAAIDADVIHMHWISYFADYPSFFRSIPPTIPMVWSLHDTNAFTGGCHYTAGCDQFVHGCGHCPQLTQRRRNDVSRASFDAKRKALAGRSIHVVAPCQWMIDMATRSPIWPRDTTFRKLEYGLDLDLQYPLPSESLIREARSALGINPNIPVIAFGAMDVENRRKGFQYLVPALEQLAQRVNYQALAFGAGDLTSMLQLCDQPPAITQLGYIDCDTTKRNILTAADVVVVPSIEDNQPQVGLEAMACGTPVVAFDAAGMSEYVVDQQTGVLCETGDVDDMVAQLEALLRDREICQSLGENARQLMEERFDAKQQLTQWQQLYRSLEPSRQQRRAG